MQTSVIYPYDERGRSPASQLYEQARSFMDKDSWEDAIVLFKKAAELTPHFKTYELWGECLMKLGRFSEAILPLAAATGLNKGIRPSSLLSDAFFQASHYSEAVDAAKTALERDPKNKIALSILEKSTAKLNEET